MIPSEIRLAILILASYLVASIPVGYLITRAVKRADIRQYGTGNVGGSNVYRNVGPAAGLAVSLLSIAQGVWPVLVSLQLGFPTHLAGIAGIAAVVGYGWPVFLRFKGGRAAGVALGVFLALAPIQALVLVAFFTLGYKLRVYALSMFVGFGLLPFYVWLALGNAPLALVAAAIYLLLLVRRLEGVFADFQDGGNRTQIVLNRLLHDRRPGQVLEGRRESA